jgi:6,7-dimethyl-8-ribityllumazine synthase
VPEVHTPKRFSVMEPKRPKAEERTQQEDAAHLDAVSDTMLAPNATMSTPATGPVKTVVHHEDDDLFAPSPEVPPAPPSPSPLPAQAPPVTPMPRPAAWGPSKSMMTPPAHGVAVHASPPAAETHGEAAAPPPHAPHAPDAPSVKPGGTVPRIGLVQCDFNHAITTAMAASALAEAHRLGAPVVQHLHVPGVFDSPLAVKTLLERRDVDAVVVVGAVLQGETGHDELISHAAAQTLLAIACNTGKPVGLGITGPRMSRPQAESRVHSGAFAVASVVAQHRMLVGLAA